MEEYEIEQIKEQKAKLDSYLELHDELIDRCEEWIAEFGWYGSTAHDINIHVFNEAYPPYIIANYTYHTISDSNCGYDDRDGQEKIPLSIFWDDECVAKEKKKRWDKQMEELKKRDEQKKVQDMKDKATRYEQYLTLREEFEDET